MQFFRDTSTLPGPFPRAVLTIGNFDGVHRGHQMIIHEVVERARRINGTAVLMTFDPPPAQVLGKATTLQITTLEDRIGLVAALGIDVFICETFTRELANTSPENFVRGILEERLAPAQILIGYDFCFGKDRKGDATFLKGWFGPRGVEIYQFGALTEAGGAQAQQIVSSSNIRKLLVAGEVAHARWMLGRPHFVRGEVVHGDARGRQIGFPTANLHTANELLPAHGVYATRATVDGECWDSVTNVGNRPTFGGATVTVEAHLLGFDRDLYGKEMKLEFLERIRGEQRFPGIDALKAQIARDVESARRILGERERRLNG